MLTVAIGLKYYGIQWLPSTEKKIFWRMMVTKQMMVAIDFHSIFSYYDSEWLPAIQWLPTFFNTSSFVFNRRKKFVQVWNNMRVSKW